MAENEVRRQRIAWLIDEFEVRVGHWRDRRVQADSESGIYVGRHKTQLEAVTSLLNGSSGALRSELAKLDGALDSGAFFLRSRRIADSAVWLERIWQFFAERFDQRDAEPSRPEFDRLALTLAAADEIVWSCYRPAYAHPRVIALELPKQPPPLAFVEPEYSPAARPLTSGLGLELEPSPTMKALNEVAGQLPMPLLRLPPWAVGAPWWLIFIAHEVGHHLQHELKLIGAFRRAIEGQAAAAGATEKDIQRWGRWGEEIFADTVSLLLVGPWALWAIVEVERGPAPAMTRRRTRYPPALLRLSIMASMLDRLGVDATSALRELSLEAPDGAAQTFAIDQKVAERIAPLVEQIWPGLGRLPRLLRFNAADFKAGGVVEQSAERLLSDSDLAPNKHLDTGRELVAASLAAWARLSDEAPPDLRERADLLATRASTWIASSAPSGERSDSMPAGKNPEPGRLLATKLLALAENSSEEEDLA